MSYLSIDIHLYRAPLEKQRSVLYPSLESKSLESPSRRTRCGPVCLPRTSSTRELGSFSTTSPSFPAPKQGRSEASCLFAWRNPHRRNAWIEFLALLAPLGQKKAGKEKEEKGGRRRRRGFFRTAWDLISSSAPLDCLSVVRRDLFFQTSCVSSFSFFSTLRYSSDLGETGEEQGKEGEGVTQQACHEIICTLEEVLKKVGLSASSFELSRDFSAGILSSNRHTGMTAEAHAPQLNK